MFKELFTEMIVKESSNAEKADLIKKSLKGHVKHVAVVGIGSGTADIVLTVSKKDSTKIKGQDIADLISKEIPVKFDKNTKSDLYYKGVPTIQAADWRDEAGDQEVYIPLAFI